MKDFVKIQSERTIQVTCGLQYNNYTDKKSQAADKLKIAPTWFDKMIVIKQGAHVYPSEVAEWPTVKALVKDGKLTIGEELDECNDENTLADKERIKNTTAKTKLADIAGEE